MRLFFLFFFILIFYENCDFYGEKIKNWLISCWHQPNINNLGQKNWLNPKRSVFIHKLRITYIVFPYTWRDLEHPLASSKRCKVHELGRGWFQVQFHAADVGVVCDKLRVVVVSLKKHPRVLGLSYPEPDVFFMTEPCLADLDVRMSVFILVNQL